MLLRGVNCVTLEFLSVYLKRDKHVKLEIGLRDPFMIIESNLMLTVKMIIIK